MTTSLTQSDDPPLGPALAEMRRSGKHDVLQMNLSDPNVPSIRARAFIFSDPRSRALIPLIERTAPSEATVLITGETGTGKELVARYVHGLSNRANKPFVAVNCGAFSEALIEGELFGYEKGAFTGATVARQGWFEAANGGTLFLDEIGDLPLALQVKLLRILQEREVVRIGSRKAMPLDIRLIAATNVDLQKSVESGRFREDLYYRLQVVSLPLLPLRARRADILPLARYFMEVYGDRLNVQRLDLSSSAEEMLYEHSWPGNIRELENTIHRATLTCANGLIEVADLALTVAAVRRPAFDDPAHLPGVPNPVEMHPSPSSRRAGGTTADLTEVLPPILDELMEAGHMALLDELVAATVRHAFARSDGNQIRTAATLGITRNVVRTHLKNLGLLGR